jgi:mRNA-degrading endonuclease RelE of RelBE toxin-antitoxin system
VGSEANRYIPGITEGYQEKQKALEELEKKIQRLENDPIHIGGWLSGKLHGKKSIRILTKYRLIFTPDCVERTEYLNWIDHREHVY